VRQLFSENNVNPKVQRFTRKACSAYLLFHSDALPELSQATAWFFFEKLREWPFGPPIGGPIGHFSIALNFLIFLRKQVGAQAPSATTGFKILIFFVVKPSLIGYYVA